MEYLENEQPILINANIFNNDAHIVAQTLLGKVLQVRQGDHWLMSRIIETEAYTLEDKASHASLGYTNKRKSLFMPPGTIYMYYARGGDSLNFSCRGRGNAVLIKSAYPVAQARNNIQNLQLMLKNNPARNGQPRSLASLCAGQTLLCRSMGLRVPDWDGHQMNPARFRLVDDSYRPEELIQTTRLGINPHRDAHLPNRYIDARFTKFCTKNPLSVRGWQIGKDYTIFCP